jgi:hypothetical protein
MRRGGLGPPDGPDRAPTPSGLARRGRRPMSTGMAGDVQTRAPGAQQPERAPTVADLRGMSDRELIERHDAIVSGAGAGGWEAIQARVYLDELRDRRLQGVEERLLRLTFALWLLSAITLILVVLVLIFAL